MVRTELKPHPRSRTTAARHIEVEILRPDAGTLELRFRLIGAIGGLLLPVRSAPARTDRLWQHSCFEAFVRGRNGRSYYEFNFSPSTRWAAYRFDDYRAGMRNADGFEAVPIEVEAGGDLLELKVVLDLSKAPDLDREGALELNITAVVEETDGTKSWWALAHPAGTPDFHHPDCFVLKVPAANST